MADIPLFYVPQRLDKGSILALPEDTARHVAQVLRMAAGERIELTDGEGGLASCVISDAGKKKVVVAVDAAVFTPQPAPGLHLAVAFTKNASRNEWLLEKATELGVRQITPLITGRSIRERIRPERWNAILVSAMLQSKQAWLPLLRGAAGMEALLESEATKLIAHCMDAPRQPLPQALKRGEDVLLLIGPEGDFTPGEVSLATAAGAMPVSLGPNRLRTETAALAAITHFYLANHAA